MQNFLTILGIIYQVAAQASDVFDHVQEAAKDGSFSASDAHDLGVRLANEVGDIRIQRNGRDLIRMTAQEEFFSFCCRVARQWLIADGVISG